MNLKLKIIGSHSQHFCTEIGYGCYLIAKVSCINEKKLDSNGFSEYYAMKNYVYTSVYDPSGKAKTEDASSIRAQGGDGLKKGGFFYLYIGVELGERKCYTRYKYVWE